MKSYTLRAREHENLLDDLLAARGVDFVERDAFLNPDFVQGSADPYLLPDMERAVERILAAKKNNEKVAVWSDYDVDGTSGGVMLVQFLRALPLDVAHYIPHRHEEGYGLNAEGLSELARAGVTLVVTVDLGSSDVGPVAHAKSLGTEVIVTDHHEVPVPGPVAYALVNPKHAGSQYPFMGLCGAGVAWKLVQAILQKERPASWGQEEEKWLLDLVGLATLSDRVPLRGENRMLAHFGLRVLRRARRPGLAALLDLLRIRPHTLTEDDVGFMLAPRINAASRMDSPHSAAKLLMSADPLEAKQLAQELDTLNHARKGIVAATVKEAKRRLAQSVESPVIVLGNPAWRPGVLGLVAGALCEAERKPVFVWGREGGSVIRGSCRSDGSVSVVELMQGAHALFGEYGGHHASGGFSLPEENIHTLGDALRGAYERTRAQAHEPQPTVIDRELPLGELGAALPVLAQLAPFGEGHQKPLFVLPNISLGRVRTFGKQQNHLDVELIHGTTRAAGVAFFSTPESFTKKADVGGRADIVGHVERDWRGQPRVRIVDIL
ncbi:MAG: single-stranded-DNA-specific exonuclease RecJ [Patescibacteria group bacterium]|nr:single-stranded-DNA-specific exonuclease RecJ [Patescibacteria group bacterium]